jgi:DNA-binding FadR family transcriptional regulator
MAKPVGERVAEFRARQKHKGLVTISLNVPEQDAHFFRDMAAKARARKRPLRARQDGDADAEKGLSPAQRRRAEQWVALSGAKIDLDIPTLKLGEVLARCIAEEILRAGWPIGHYLGSESDLRERYDVGRNLLGEAVRVLEHQSIARMRRGSSGGLFSDKPSLESTAYMAGLYLEYRRVSNADLLRTRREIQHIVVRRAIERLDAKGRRKLKEILHEEQTYDGRSNVFFTQHFHNVLAQLTGDPVLELLTDLLLKLFRNHVRLRSRAPTKGGLSPVFELHRDIAQAMLDGDAERACAAVDKHMALIEKILL